MAGISKTLGLKLGGTFAGLYGVAITLATSAYAATEAYEAIELEEHHGSGGLPQFDLTTFPSQIFWLLIMFAFRYMFFAKKTLPEISSTLENRREQVKSDLEIAEKLRAEAEQAQHDYETGLIKAREESTKTMAKTQQKISEKAEKASNDYREKMEKEMAALEGRLGKAQSEAMDDMNTIAAEVASEAAKKIVGISPDLKEAKTVVKSLNDNGRKAA